MIKILVYGKPGCVQCKYTCAELRKLITKGHLPQNAYEYLDIATDEDAAHEVEAMRQEMGFTTLPLVVVTNGKRTEKWAGLQLDKLRGLKETGNY